MKDKIRVGILGATGIVGQRLISMLDNHPFFQVTGLMASEKSINKKYSEVVHWKIQNDIPENIKDLEVKSVLTHADCDIVLSSLPADIADSIEENLKNQGLPVITNSSPHRMDEDVPLIIPEVNHDHINLIKGKKGFILANPNCCAVALTIALAPLYINFGVESVIVSTYQAISGAGYPGVSALDITDNLVPYIKNEEDKVESEPLKILGDFKGKSIEFAKISISSQCVRVNVIDGHFMTVSVKLTEKVKEQEIIEAFNSFSKFPKDSKLPTLPEKLIQYLDDESRPQPRLDRDRGSGMTISVGRLRKCPVQDYKFVVLGHNTIRGAAGAAIANAELCHVLGFI
jgi:aspartate-semialdehyde dehydrogenase